METAWKWSAKTNNLRKNEIHGEEEARILLSESFTLLDEEGHEISMSGSMEVDASCRLYVATALWFEPIYIGLGSLYISFSVTLSLSLLSLSLLFLLDRSVTGRNVGSWVELEGLRVHKASRSSLKAYTPVEP